MEASEVIVMSKKEIIRKAEAKDQKDLLKLVRRNLSSDEEFAKRYYKSYFEKAPVASKDAVFVAEKEDKIVGTIGYCSDYFSTDYSYWLGWLVVSKNERRKDIGSHLLKKVERGLKRKGNVKRLFVSVDDKNKQAISFYNDQGFNFEARLRAYYSAKGDQIVLSKKIK